MGRPETLCFTNRTGIITREVRTDGAELKVARDALIAFGGGPTAADHVEPGKYESAFDAESDDFLILPHDAVGRDGLAVRGQVEQPDARTVVCRYSVLAPALTDRGARCLIRSCVLTDLLDIDRTDRDLTVRFERITNDPPRDC